MLAQILENENIKKPVKSKTQTSSVHLVKFKFTPFAGGCWLDQTATKRNYLNKL